MKEKDSFNKAFSQQEENINNISRIYHECSEIIEKYENQFGKNKPFAEFLITVSPSEYYKLHNSQSQNIKLSTLPTFQNNEENSFNFIVGMRKIKDNFSERIGIAIPELYPGIGFMFLSLKEALILDKDDSDQYTKARKANSEELDKLATIINYVKHQWNNLF